MGAVGSFVGDTIGAITGSGDAGDAQAQAAQQSAGVQKEQFEATRKDLLPFVQAGAAALPQLQASMAPINRTQAFSDYFRGPEYAMMQEQASRNQLAANEAMGGMGATSTGNALASIAPQLAMQNLSGLEASQMDQYNRAMGLANLGQSSAAQTGAAGQQYASGAARAYQQEGEARAMQAMAPWQTASQLGGMFMSGMAMGAF